MTTFQLINKKTNLALNVPLNVSNPGQAGLVVQLYTPSDRNNNYWQFLVDENACFQIVNYQTQMALAAYVQGSVAPDWSATKHAGIESPVIEVPQVGTVDGQASSGFGPQEWTVRAPAPLTPSFGENYFELIVSPRTNTTVSQWVMNFPDHLLSNDNAGVAVQVSPGNGGLDNEQWTLKNTTSPAPQFTFVDTSVFTEGTGWYLDFNGSGFTPGAAVTLMSLELPGRGVVGKANGGGTADNNGNLTGQLYLSSSYGERVPGEAPDDQLVTVVAYDENQHVVAFSTVPSSYWYIQG